MTFYFFDLETSGFDPVHDRIMQFAGQRTDTNLKPIGEPDNFLIKITPDILPQPDAVLVHGITPQRTLSEGITEAEFCNYLTSQVCTSDTLMVGFNNIRFDNNFIRFTLWRNFYDAYEWSWKDGCSTWDLLVVTRMTRALRPDGIQWPFASDGRPSNKLEFLSAVNKLDHADAHEALSDVKACLALANLLKAKQPKLFDYLLHHRSKDKIIPLITSGKPVAYTSGRYPSEYHKTALAVMAAQRPDKSGALMYDLRIDPEEFSKLPAAELAKRWAARGDNVPYFPVKVLTYNKCPAVAPAEVLAVNNGYQKLGLHKQMVDNHLAKLKKYDDFGKKLLQALDIMWPKRPAQLVSDAQTVDGQLYESFVSDADKTKMAVIRAASPDDLTDPGFKDQRLSQLLPLYKARNFSKMLEPSEQEQWLKFCEQKLVNSGQADKFFKRLSELANTPGLDGGQKYLLEELNLYAQSVTPVV